MHVLFENEDLILVNKPHGCLTTPARDANDKRRCLGRELQAQVAQQIFPVHRLDFEVSGLVMFAKTKVAHSATQKWFEEGAVQKLYQAQSARAAEAPQAWVEWNSRLVRGKRRAFEASHGKEARTMARVVEASAPSLWELKPLTGRSHQLRFEMAKHGYPILGDVLYGGEPGPPDQIALNAVELDFSQIAERFGLPEKLRTADLQIGPWSGRG